jgi:hypothetical protein
MVHYVYIALSLCAVIVHYWLLVMVVSRVMIVHTHMVTSSVVIVPILMEMSCVVIAHNHMEISCVVIVHTLVPWPCTLALSLCVVNVHNGFKCLVVHFVMVRSFECCMCRLVVRACLMSWHSLWLLWFCSRYESTVMVVAMLCWVLIGWWFRIWLLWHTWLENHIFILIC